MTTTVLHIGPYAEWEFPRSADPFDRLDDSLHDDGGQIEWHFGSDPGVGFERGGEAWVRHCCLPLAARPGCPARQMTFRWSHLGEDVGVWADWTSAEPAAEVTWFRVAFAGELTRVAALFRSPPQLRWGLLRWVIP